MKSSDTDELVAAVAAGFEALQAEYQKLHGQHQALERRLATTREQYSELAKLCNTTGALSSPPLSLASSTNPQEPVAVEAQSAAEILDQHSDNQSQDAASKIRQATQALNTLKQLPERNLTDTVKIWSGRSADEPHASHKPMPAVHESPLEQDFTIEGVPSKLGCPFASMANKKLSSHAASVLSRYGHGNQGGAAGTSVSAASRINGRESFARRSSQRANFADLVEAELPQGLDHDRESPHSERVASGPDVEVQDDAEVGVCPIRFLDQQSPEEVATYFEKHKHELPRSHEVCVKRYQSNEQQIRQLDAKYGNLANMIQGLGAKHQSFLPREPDEELVDAAETAASAEKVRKWARSVSMEATNGNEAEHDDGDEERLPHFERPLRDIRVGESPSRPWGISVPPKYLERKHSAASSQPAAVQGTAAEPAAPLPNTANAAAMNPPPLAEANERKCPFSFGAKLAESNPVAAQPPQQQASAPFANQNAKTTSVARPPADVLDESAQKSERIVFKGPVFFGYSAEDATKMLQQMM